MEIRYKRAIKLKAIWEDYNDLVIALLVIFFIIFFSLSIGYIVNLLGVDKTENSEVETVKKTTLIIKKTNGLTCKYYIESNGELKIKKMPLNPNVLFIQEKGKNFIGISIDVTTKIEGVDTFYVEKIP